MGHLGHQGHARLARRLEQYVPGAFPSETLCAILRVLATEEEARLLAILPLRPAIIGRIVSAARSGERDA